jgi:hypothetical protein
MDNYDYSGKTADVDPNITLEEHPVGCGPTSYMAFSNLRNAKHEIEEILIMLNACDDLPQWADQMLAEATDRLSSVKSYILSQKDVQPIQHGSNHHNHETMEAVPMPQAPAHESMDHTAPTVYVEDYGGY